jgi:nucleotide-binding universal stress UspA family protein
MSFGCRLILMHVVSGKPNPDPATREWIEDNCRTKLLRLLSPASSERNLVETHLCYRDPAQEILAAAHSKQVDFVVLGAGTHGPLSDHVPWRTLTKVIRNASWPILNVKRR